MAHDVVNEENVYLCVGHPLRRDIENILTWMLNEDFTSAFKSIPLAK
jgi:replication factor C subunit 3/5